MKVTEFLKGRNVKRQAVTRYINRHDEVFKGHIKKVGKELDLDLVAIKELDKVYPYLKPLKATEGVPQEEFIELQKKLIDSQQRLFEAQEELARERSKSWVQKLFKKR